MNRTRWPLAAIALITIMSAACSNTGAKTGTGDSGGDTAIAASHAQAVKFAECMRSHGYRDFPDPNASGDFESFGISVSPEVWTKALDACKDLQPPGTFTGNRSPEQEQAALKFAQCIRDNGVKDFPDPVNGDPLIDTTKIPSVDGSQLSPTERSRGMAVLQAAMKECRNLLGDAMRSGK